MTARWLVLAVALSFPQQRDSVPPVVTGTAEIAGVVMSAGSDPQPLHRAVVTLTGAAVMPRSVLTDDGGRFSFARLPAGTYSVTARKAAYLAAAYGAKMPGRSGMSIVLAERQRADITLTMFRGGAISGMLRDAGGAPVGGINVRVIDARTLLTVLDTSPPQLAMTDDRGIFRIFGLLPGDYFVVALPQPAGPGEVVAPTESFLDSALATLAARRNAPMSAQPTSTPRQRPIGYGPVYFPGTWNYLDAMRVHVDAGEERSGVSFELSPLPMASIDGVVSGDVPMSAVQLTIISSGPRVDTVMSSNSLSGRALDAEGRFRYANLPPGSYRLVARGRRGDSAPTPAGGGAVIVAGGAGGSGQSAQPAATEYLYGFADVELRGVDAAVSLVLQPGGTLSGRIVFGGNGSATRPADLSKAIRVSLSLGGAGGSVTGNNGLSMGTNLVSSQLSTIGADGTFEIRSIGPGRFAFGATLPAAADAAVWKLRSAMTGDRDLLDQPIDLGPGTDIRDVVVTFSDAPTELSGTLQTGAGAVTTQYDIVALPADRTLWQPKSRRVLSARPATDGRFVFADLPAGDYLIAAVSELDPLDLLDAAFLEQIASAGTPVKVREGEKNIQNLKIR